VIESASAQPYPSIGLMREVALARMWHLPNGTSCLLLKDPRSQTWEIRVTRGDLVLRTEHFGSPITAMDHAKRWRAVFETAVEAN
jgi:hypothetical protein